MQKPKFILVPFCFLSLALSAHDSGLGALDSRFLPVFLEPAPNNQVEFLVKDEWPGDIKQCTIDELTIDHSVKAGDGSPYLSSVETKYGADKYAILQEGKYFNPYRLIRKSGSVRNPAGPGIAIIAGDDKEAMDIFQGINPKFKLEQHDEGKNLVFEKLTASAAVSWSNLSHLKIVNEEFKDFAENKTYNTDSLDEFTKLCVIKQFDEFSIAVSDSRQFSENAVGDHQRLAFEVKHFYTKQQNDLYAYSAEEKRYVETKGNVPIELFNMGLSLKDYNPQRRSQVGTYYFNFDNDQLVRALTFQIIALRTSDLPAQLEQADALVVPYNEKFSCLIRSADSLKKVFTVWKNMSKAVLGYEGTIPPPRPMPVPGPGPSRKE